MRPVPERAAAKAAGERFYFVTKPCQNGHTSKRSVANGGCCECLDVNRRRWMAARPGIEAKWARERRAKDPTGHRAEVKRYKQKNSDKVRDALNAWKAANLDHVRRYGRIYRSVRRTKERENGGSYTEADVEALFRRQKGKCASCPRKLKNYEIDHINPVIRGGSSDPSNLQLLCRPCNRSKGGKDPFAWAQSKGLLL